MSLQSGIASHVITKRLVNADYIIRPAILTKRKFISEHKKTTTKYAARFQGVELYVFYPQMLL
jgi:hypothetical protein